MEPAKNSELGNPYWEATYYGSGIGAMTACFKTEKDALEWWDENKTNPEKTLTALTKVKIIRSIGWDRLEKKNGQTSKGRQRSSRGGWY